jgi:hypothetical protein
LNEKDLQLVHLISPIIDSDRGSSIYLFNIKFTNMVRLNLVLLKVLLEEQKRKGLMITIDRPHQYLSHLMQLHALDQTDLVFIDTISGHASDTKGGAAAPEFQNGPFQIDTLPDFLYGGGNGGTKSSLDMSKVEFVLIDNVSTLLTYNSMENVRRFLQKYTDIIGKTSPNGIQTVLVMDRDLHPDLFQFVSAFSKKAINFGPDMTIESISVPGAKVSESQQSSTQESAAPVRVDSGIPRDKEVM